MTEQLSGERARAAAEVLRRASSVMFWHGFTRETFMDPRTAAVCLDGAINVAAGFAWVQRTEADGYRYGYGRMSRTMSVSRATYMDACKAVIPMLPDRCDERHDGRPACGFLGENQRRIHHYNDYVCTGGREARLVLDQAAEKLEAEL